jgi:predicted lipoprotein with Yx(FWY)xxD motif
MQMKIMMSALGLSAMVALAACGSSSKVSTGAQPSVASTTTTSAPETSSTMKVASAAPIVMTSSTKLGSVLVDDKGMTLYTLTNAGQPVECTGQCATFWPPLLLPSGTATATGGAGVTGLGTTAAAGGKQVTVNGDPVYRFSIDKKPGDTNGEGITSFGGTWHVAKAVGTTVATTPATSAPVTAAPVTNPPATPPTTAYNYGY